MESFAKKLPSENRFSALGSRIVGIEAALEFVQSDSNHSNHQFFRYDRDPHFPRDAQRLNLSPIKLRSIDSSASMAAAAAAANSAAIAAAKAAEPNVDFEFHVNIFINRELKVTDYKS